MCYIDNWVSTYQLIPEAERTERGVQPTVYYMRDILSSSISVTLTTNEARDDGDDEAEEATQECSAGSSVLCTQ